MINSVSLKLFDDSALSALIAHELGHVIDYQTGRKKHPFFIEANIIGLKDAENIAWALAIFITSREIVEHYFSTKRDLYL